MALGGAKAHDSHSASGTRLITHLHLTSVASPSRLSPALNCSIVTTWFDTTGDLLRPRLQRHHRDADLIDFLATPDLISIKHLSTLICTSKKRFLSNSRTALAFAVFASSKVLCCPRSDYLTTERSVIGQNRHHHGVDCYPVGDCLVRTFSLLLPLSSTVFPPLSLLSRLPLLPLLLLSSLPSSPFLPWVVCRSVA